MHGPKLLSQFPYSSFQQFLSWRGRLWVNITESDFHHVPCLIHTLIYMCAKVYSFPWILHFFIGFFIQLSSFSSLGQTLSYNKLYFHLPLIKRNIFFIKNTLILLEMWLSLTKLRMREKKTKIPFHAYYSQSHFRLSAIKLVLIMVNGVSSQTLCTVNTCSTTVIKLIQYPLVNIKIIYLNFRKYFP